MKSESFENERCWITDNYTNNIIGRSYIIHADCFDWLKQAHDNSIHAVVTDPPYGVKEFEVSQIEKMTNGKGGIWRIPPSFDGSQRAPLPRFTALNKTERETLFVFFKKWAKLLLRVLRPGAHVFVASNAFISQLTFSALIEGGLEFRGELIRLVRTLRGGDRPKNAEEEFPGVCSMARGCYEPWGIFRKPIPEKMTISECLRSFKTGGIRRLQNGNPFEDVIVSERTPKREREIADHPSLKPQSFLRKLVYSALPLGEGLILDPFMGSGSTTAACEAMGLSSIGIEKHPGYYEIAKTAIPKLMNLGYEFTDNNKKMENFRLPF